MTLTMTNDLRQSIMNTVKRELGLPPNTRIDVQFGEGEIRIKYSKPNALTGAQNNEEQLAEDRAFVLAALEDAYEKMQFPFIGLTWFRDKYLPVALGANLPPQRIRAAIMSLIARGELVVDKVPSINDETHLVTAIRTPRMPISRVLTSGSGK